MERRKAWAIEILSRAGNFVKGILLDYPILILPKYDKNPVELTLIIDCSPPEER